MTLLNLGRVVQTYPTAEELQLLTTNLALLLKVFENPVNEDIIKANVPQFVTILDVLESIARSCTECAKALDIDLAGARIATKTESRGKRFVKRIWTFNKISDLLAEIQRKAEQLQQIYSAIFAVMLQDIWVQQGRTSGKETVESTTVTTVQKPTVHENLHNLDLGTDFVNIDRLVGSLIKECEYLRRRLRKATLFPDSSAVQNYHEQNPEAASFWKDRFQKDELNASALRYETLYVSWARFVHEVETSFVLKKIPTGIFETGNIDLVCQKGSRYSIDQNGTRRLSTIRPLWLPALRAALDPLHKGYVKPHDYFDLLHDSSLSDSLRRLAPRKRRLRYTFPTPHELGIVTEREAMESSTDTLFAYFKDTNRDVYVHVRYLQTGQIERKSLSKRLESGGHAWSNDLHITEFRACYGGRYIITAGVGSTAVVFSTRPLKNSFNKMLLDDDNPSGSTIPEFEFTLLGPSKAFIHHRKLAKRFRYIEYDGFWYDSRVTVVDGDEIEYVDWDSAPEQVPTDITEAQDDSEGDEKDSGSLFFSDEQLTQLGKGTRRLWRPWRRNIQRYDVRPYRCFHIGDSIEAPVMYPDFRYHYHVPNNSELYLPARIVDVQGDQYVIEFSPALSVHTWWPGRMSKGEQIELVPGSGIKVANPLDFNRMTVGMDRVCPFSAGPRPVLGVQSVKPSGWSSFQGVRLSNLEDLLERSLWNNDGDSQRSGYKGCMA
ncbi:hypothetical protein N656DRAFT_793423 [Canariomyces notabilis]|uniref:Uncharacterized protein n=1 Tax=Canariomyces notabilis TaxID=2074819 RepID=A0AAN6QBD8_9PEZI|nr:hypothetical protein N656DRAFT_793423 [Canariomyces arenarius]